MILLLAAQAFGQLSPKINPSTIKVFRTLADMDASSPSREDAYSAVGGYTSSLDWGEPKFFRYDPTSTAPTNDVVRAVPNGLPGRRVHPWDGDIRAFGAIPYDPLYTLVPWGWKGQSAGVGSGDFTVWIKALLPTNYTSAQGLFEISPAPTVSAVPAETLSSFGMRASPDVWGFVFRSTNGASGAGSTIDDAAVLESSPSALSAWAGQLVDIVITRSGTNCTVYFNGTNVISLFTFNNPAGWAKPLAIGGNLFYQVGNNVNGWYWTKPVHAFAFWNSVLSQSQATNPAAVGSKIVYHLPANTNEPPDLTANFNAASDYNQSRGGGQILIPSGVYRVGGSVKIGKSTSWKGSGTSPYPSVHRQAFRPSATTIFQWFQPTNSTFLGNQDQGTEVCLTPRNIYGSGNGLVSSRWLRSELMDFTIAGPVGSSGSANGIELDRVASIGIHNVNFYGCPGYDIKLYACNSIRITDCDSALSGRTIDVRGVADYTISECFFDSGKGPILRVYANLGRVANNVFEISQNPRTTVPPYEYVTTVNTATDEFTVTSSFGHGLNLGTPIRFDADSTNVLAAPLNEFTDYYAIPTGPNTYKVSTRLVAEDLQLGALYSNDVLDITDTGTGTWYSGVGQSANIYLSGDHNAVIGNHGQQPYEFGLVLDGTFASTINNSIIGNHWMLYGPGNPNTNEVAGIYMINAFRNNISGNQVDDRDVAGYGQNGIIQDALSSDNYLDGNSWNVDRPYSDLVLARNTVLDGQVARLKTGRVLVSDYGSTNLNYAILGSANSSLNWQATNVSGTLSGTNTGSAKRFISMRGPYFAGGVYGQVDESSISANAGKAFTYRAYRNGTNLINEYAPLTAYQKLGAFEMGGWMGYNPTDTSVAAEVSAWSSATDWNLTNSHSQMHFAIVGANSALLRSAMILQFPASGDTNSTPLIISRHNGTNWLDAPQGWSVTLGTNNSGGSGKRVLVVPNN